MDWLGLQVHNQRYRIRPRHQEMGGIGKEFFTSADNYALQISESVPQDHIARRLILAAVMCIDMVLKE